MSSTETITVRAHQLRRNDILADTGQQVAGIHNEPGRGGKTRITLTNARRFAKPKHTEFEVRRAAG